MGQKKTETKQINEERDGEKEMAMELMRRRENVGFQELSLEPKTHLQELAMVILKLIFKSQLSLGGCFGKISYTLVGFKLISWLKVKF